MVKAKYAELADSLKDEGTYTEYKQKQLDQLQQIETNIVRASEAKRRAEAAEEMTRTAKLKRMKEEAAQNRH